jgi:hypothetical protein
MLVDFGHGGQTIETGKQRGHSRFKIGNALVIGEINRVNFSRKGVKLRTETANRGLEIKS